MAQVPDSFTKETVQTRILCARQPECDEDTAPPSVQFGELQAKKFRTPRACVVQCMSGGRRNCCAAGSTLQCVGLGDMQIAH
mmetsp:Transcript_69332/g.136056  ORF Transcript_69332/g.136056 Transcript_69332/m.136056 type:complete len:82 (-) Transcript_69332:41-286(-)